jgi:HSP20 family molecular chaperone IbpA
MQSNYARMIVPTMLRRLKSSQPVRLAPHRTFFSRRSNALWDVGDTFRQMERQFEHMENELASTFRNLGIRGNRFLPSISMDLATPPMTMYETETADKYTMNVVIGKGLPPENIKVNLKDRLIEVEVKYEKTYGYEDGKSKISQELLRAFTLPEGIDTSQVKSLLTPDGILQFTAPLPPKAVEESQKPHEIPINNVSAGKD